jgi:hypothetical protein
VWQCTSGTPNECVLGADITEEMEKRQFYIEVLLAYFEYNVALDKVELKYKTKNVPGDGTIVAIQLLELK